MDNYCKNHPNKKAISFCQNCGNYFCTECLNEGQVYYYCNEEECYQRFLEEGGATKTSDSKKTKLSVIIATVIIVALAGTVGKELAKKFFSQSQKVSVESSDWNIRQIESTGLSLEIPFDLEKSELELPDEYKDMIKQMLTYQYSTNPLSVKINYVVYSEDIIHNLDGAAEGAINNMRNSKGISDFTYSISETFKNNISGRIIKGKFKIEKQSAEYKGVIFAEDTRTWQVICTFLANEENRTVINKMLNSVKIAL